MPRESRRTDARRVCLKSAVNRAVVKAHVGPNSGTVCVASVPDGEARAVVLGPVDLVDERVREVCG